MFFIVVFFTFYEVLMVLVKPKPAFHCFIQSGHVQHCLHVLVPDTEAEQTAVDRSTGIV